VPLAKPNESVLAAADRALGHARGKTLSEYEASRVFAALDVPVAKTQVVQGPGDAVQLPFPVVAKILSPDIAHKTNIGGVVLNIADRPALSAAVEQIFARVKKAHPEAKLDGILVQPMEKGLAEVIVGFKRDPQVGPVVVLGVGGVLAEIYRDYALRLAPVTVETARAMIEEVKGLATIRGYRGMVRGDTEALARTVAAVSQLAAVEPTVAEAEINPLLVRPEGQGVVAVDGLIVLATAG
jgi:succinyl-CoA synthetase beta subunit